MLVVRSIPALQNLVGVEASFEVLVHAVRAYMKLPLGQDQYTPYRGITSSGLPSTEFAEIYNVKTTEDLIIAQGTGAYMTPVDRPNDIYLFSCEKGVVGLVSPDVASELFRKAGAARPAPDQTFDQLHSEYKSWAIGEGYEWEPVMQEVAADFVTWACAKDCKCGQPDL